MAALVGFLNPRVRNVEAELPDANVKPAPKPEPQPEPQPETAAKEVPDQAAAQA
jgi:hypothetical protein